VTVASVPLENEHRVRRVRVMSFHAGYACASSGACCSAGWPIPVEAHVLPVLRGAIESGAVVAGRGSRSLTFPEARPEEVGAVLGRTATGACVFFDRGQRDGCCRVQRHAGMAAMPIACRQFPRIVRHDADGTDISLSHWCPTALSTLDEPAGPARIVDAPGGLAAHALEGLDARETWPPLLRADCLADRDAYDAVEAATVDILANGSGPVHGRLRRVAALYERLRTWRPGEPQTTFVFRTIREWQDSPHDDVAGVHGDAIEGHARAALRDAVLEAVPREERWRVPGHPPAAPPHDARDVLDAPAASRRLGRYLAARAFGAWIAYQGRGLRTVAAYLAAVLATVECWLPAVDGRDADDRCVTGEPADARVSAAIRTADLLLLHLGSPERLARSLSDWERAPLPFSASG